jgi:acid phosphatase type 7
VTSATLRIFPTSSQSTGFTVFSVADTTCVESTIVDANAPPFGASLGSSGPASTGVWTNVVVTPVVRGNGLISFGLSTTNATALALFAREGANPPQLVITTGP